MIDFQNGGLEHQVYELIAKMCDLACSDEFPHFQTTPIENGRWECKLSIPGVKKDSIGYGKTEVDSVNECALNMLAYLKMNHKNDDYDPDMEESIFRGNIEQFFGDIDYDYRYTYHLCETDILLDSNSYIADSLKRMIANKIEKDDSEIDAMSNIVTLRFLIKKEKKNYC